MNWNQVLVLCTVFLAPKYLTAESLFEGVDEVLTYDCARGVATLVGVVDQGGPIFSQGQLVFTSTTASNGKPMLIATAGAGTFAIPLESVGINRIRFELPTMSSSSPQFFYLTYLHDNVLHSRVFEFSTMKAPVGKDELDYRLVQPQRASYLQPYLEYAIFETSAGLLGSLLEGTIKRQQMSLQKVDCDHLMRKSPILSRNIRRNLDELEIIAIGPGATRKRASTKISTSGGPGSGRMPAGLSAPVPVSNLSTLPGVHH